jgi:hypothetical protein
MKLAKATTSPKMTAILETAPLLALVAIAFVGSCGNVLHFFGACGITGVVQYGDTGCPDLLCLVAVREYLRDRRLGRNRKWGIVSWPILVLLIGIAMTLALGYIGNNKTMLAHISGSWIGHTAGPLPGAVLLLALSLFHRRDAGTGTAGTKRDRTKAAPGTAPAGPEPTAPVPAVSTAPPDQDRARADAPAGPPAAERTFGALLAEARAYRDELAAKGERVTKDKLRLRLTVGSTKAIQLLQALNEDGSKSTSEAVI